MRVDAVIDVDFKFDCSVHSEPHINMTYCKVYKILGFVKRLAYDFKPGMSLKILFCFLVRSILEYGSAHILCQLSSNRNSPKNVF